MTTGKSQTIVTEDLFEWALEVEVRPASVRDSHGAVTATSTAEKELRQPRILDFCDLGM